jgi:hypothetical protein
MSLIASGFTIYKFFEYLATSERRRQPIFSPWVQRRGDHLGDEHGDGAADDRDPIRRCRKPIP